MSFTIDPTCMVHPTAVIEVENGFIGPRGKIGPFATIRGRHVEIGAECWIDTHACIGGGSAFDLYAYLEAGDWLHMGMFSQVNTARGVHLGHECGIGVRTCIFTHGAYESVMEGFPVQWGPVRVGDRVWLPHAWVNPNVTIGDNVVVAAMSLVNKDLPSGCLAGGVPVKVLKENIYPHSPTEEEKHQLFLQVSNRLFGAGFAKSTECNIVMKHDEIHLEYKGETTIFDIPARVIHGAANIPSETTKDQLRRNGVRFRYIAKDGEYKQWE
jgi:acetyltransferase-like isoleucine patch superfamily enzyme